MLGNVSGGVECSDWAIDHAIKTAFMFNLCVSPEASHFTGY